MKKRAELALEEIRKIYNQHDDDTSIIDGKARDLMANSSLILTLFGVLQIALVKPDQSIVYKIGLGLSIIIYLSMLAVIMFGVLRIRSYKTVFVPSREGIYNAILGKKNYKKAVLQLIGNYVDRIQDNQLQNTKKSKYLTIASWMFVVDISLLVFLSMFVVR